LTKNKKTIRVNLPIQIVMGIKIYDNFLSEKDHKNLCESFIFNENFSLYLHNTVTYTGSEVDELWDWYEHILSIYLIDQAKPMKR